MPPTSRLLYYDLGMNADDDGYTEWFTIVRMSGSTEQDLQVLQANGFVKVFDDNVLVILDWKENNFIRSDRYTPSKYIEIYSDLTLSEFGIPTVDQRDTQVRLDKDSIGKVSTVSKDDTKVSFGELGKVRMTIQERDKLIERMGEKNVNILIDELDMYIASKGKKYSSHYATILAWARRRVEDHQNKTTKAVKL